MSKLNAFILAGGLGTRLRPLTDTIPKCLVPIAGRPLLEYWVDELARIGIQEARVNTHAHAERVREFITEIRASGRLNLTEFHEPVLLGSAGTIAANPDFAADADHVVLIYADNLSNVDLGRLLEFHRSHDDPFTIMLCRTSAPQACGIVELDSTGCVLSFEEKPKHPRGNLANAGVYVVDRSAYEEIAAFGAFDLGFDVLPRFVGRMRGWEFSGYHRDIGTHEALAQASADALHLFSLEAIPPHRRPAVFLDRDGTLIESVHYLKDPDEVRLVDGAADSLRRLARAGFALVLVTNQAAIGKGLMTDFDLERVHDRLEALLAAEGAKLDAIYHCSIAGCGSDRTVIEHRDRKPGPGMLLRAAQDLDLDLGRSWMIGDMISDVLAGRNAGCLDSILIEGLESAPDDHHCIVAPSLVKAVDAVLARTRPEDASGTRDEDRAVLAEGRRSRIDNHCSTDYRTHVDTLTREVLK
ncbi:MAG: HAD-IIIA family hydrolase [Isosphaeraceae bacterium]|nr:HAD-IIIA family hydrolase [Isosphaeraceae bacterium]